MDLSHLKIVTRRVIEDYFCLLMTGLQESSVTSVSVAVHVYAKFAFCLVWSCLVNVELLYVNLYSFKSSLWENYGPWMGFECGVR